MYPVTDADAAIFYTSINYHLERFFGMLVVFPHRFFVSFWMIEIISCFSFNFLLIGLVGQCGSVSRAKPVRRPERRVKERINLKAIIATRDKIHMWAVALR